MKLQNNYTTPEQSKRLLELGVPVDSADCIRTLYKCNGDDKQIEVLIEPYSSTKRTDINRNEMEQYPCWSVGRLMEIYCKLSESINITIPYQSGMLCEVMIRTIEHNKKRLDFSKLED